MSIVAIDGGDGDIVERRAKAIQLLFIPARAAVVGGLRAVSLILKGVLHMETVHEPLDGVNQKSRVARREFLRLGAIGGAAVAAGAVATTWMPDLRQRGLLTKDGVFHAGSIAFADSLYDEEFPISPPLDPHSVRRPAADPAVEAATGRDAPAEVAALPLPPGPGVGQQNSLRNETHQICWAERARLTRTIRSSTSST